MARYPRQTAGEKVSDEIISDTLSQLIREKGFNIRHVAISIPRHLVTVKSMSGLPASATDEDIDRMVPIQIEPELPFPLSESAYSIFNIQRSQTGISLEIVAAKKSSIQRYIDISDSAGIKLAAIIPSSFATYGIIFDRFKEMLVGKNIAVADIGAGETDFCILQHGRLSFSRSFTHGGNNLTQSYEKEYEISFDEAEEKKIREASIEEPLTIQWLDSLSLQIAQSIRAFSGKETNGGMDVLWLCGGSSNIPGINRYLEEKLSTDVSLLPEFPGIEKSLVSQVKEHELTVNMGIGLISMAGKELTPTVSMNLLPKEIIEKAQRIKKRIIMIAAAALIVIALTGTGWGITAWQRSRAALYASIEKQINEVENDIVTIHAKESLEKSILINQIMSSYVTPLEILREMSEKLPDRQKIALTNLSMEKNGKLIMGVEAASHGDVGEMIQVLSNIKVSNDASLFSEVKHGAVSKVTKDNRPILQVQIVCTLNKGTTQEKGKDEKNNKS